MSFGRNSKVSKKQMRGRIRFTNFAVDFWGIQPSLRFYFLTHVHGDHLGGLYDGWNAGPIYCSRVTKELLLNRFSIDNNLIIPLELNSRKILFLDDKQEHSFSVVAMDANHIPGAVMYLFEGFFGVYLYTGDFRYEDSMLEIPFLFEKTIDILYLDNTFNDPHFIFPSQQEATEIIINIVRNHLQEYPQGEILIGIDNIGKENLLVTLAINFNSKVVVNSQRMKDIKCMDTIPISYFTTNAEEGIFKVISKKEISNRLVVDLANRQKPTIAIYPSGWTGEFMLGKFDIQYEKDKLIYNVPYSLHSSFPELITFVKEIAPRSIVPLATTNINMLNFSDFLDPSPKTIGIPPDPIYHTSLSRSLSISNNNSVEEENNKHSDKEELKEGEEWDKSLIQEFYPQNEAETEYEENPMSKDALNNWSEKLDDLIQYSKESKEEDRKQRNVARRKGAKIEPDPISPSADKGEEDHNTNVAIIDESSDVRFKSSSRQKENRKLLQILTNQQPHVITWKPVELSNKQKNEEVNWNELHPDLQEYKKRKRRRDSKEMLIELSLETLNELINK